jgi:anti-sigma regulatory factor (Ser/Thr protein kinase)
VLRTTITPDEEPRHEADDTAEPCVDGPELLMIGQQFTSSPRGARLARRLAVRCLGEWGWPSASDFSCTVALLVGELCANAVHHGLVPGRDFHLHLGFETRRRVIRIEVSDAFPDRPPTRPHSPSPDDESGRGLFLVDLLATRWGVAPRVPVGKTVWAEVAADVPRVT